LSLRTHSLLVVALALLAGCGEPPKKDDTEHMARKPAPTPSPANPFEKEERHEIHPGSRSAALFQLREIFPTALVSTVAGETSWSMTDSVYRKSDDFLNTWTVLYENGKPESALRIGIAEYPNVAAASEKFDSAQKSCEGAAPLDVPHATRAVAGTLGGPAKPQGLVLVLHDRFFYAFHRPDAAAIDPLLVNGFFAPCAEYLTPKPATPPGDTAPVDSKGS
jgi:hypothetical protein